MSNKCKECEGPVSNYYRWLCNDCSDNIPSVEERISEEEQAIKVLNYGQGLTKAELKKCAEIITQQREQIAELKAKLTPKDGEGDVR